MGSFKQLAVLAASRTQISFRANKFLFTRCTNFHRMCGQLQVLDYEWPHPDTLELQGLFRARLFAAGAAHAQYGVEPHATAIVTLVFLQGLSRAH